MIMETVKLRKRKLANGNVSLYLEIQEDGKRKYESLGLYLVPEYTDADKIQNKNALARALELKSKHVLGVEEETEDDSTDDIELMEFMSQYLKYKEQAGERAKESMTRNFIRVVACYLSVRKQAHILMGQLTTKFAKDFIKYLQQEYRSAKSVKESKPVAASTQRNYQESFTMMLNYAVRQGIIKQNPFNALERKELIAKPISERDYLTVDEVKSIIGIDSTATEVRNAFLFACFTGLRRSDVEALTWGQVKSGINGQYISLTMKKTKKVITVPLSNSAMKYLPQRKGNRNDEKVFAMPSPSAVFKSMKKIAKDAGISKNVCFHTSRHTFATLTLSAGADLATVSQILGHTTLKTTQIYAKVLIQSKIAAISKMKKLM